MREHFRSFDSKISFFAFADIITAVSGMLIFITLLLATDLGRPDENRSSSTNPEMEKRLQQTLARQAEVDAENRQLQGLLVTATTAPDPAKLESDIARLRAELADEKNKHGNAAEELAASRSALEARDQLLGITAVREQIQKAGEDLKALQREKAKVGDEAAELEKKIGSVQSKLVKLRAREGQLWLIPDKTGTGKEAILVTVNSAGAKAERFNRPGETQQFDKSRAEAAFRAYLKSADPRSQYIVFLIRPSGIALFKDLVQIARDQGFEVGFDALEEDREIHYTMPPPIEDESIGRTSENAASPAPSQLPPRGTSATGAPGYPAGNGSAGTGTSAGNNSSTPGSPNGSREGGTNVSGKASSTGTAMDGSTVDGSNGTNEHAAGKAESGVTNAAQTGSTNATKTGSATTTNQPPTAPPPPKPKSWWQRFLEWIGIG